jgi:hypothetical protein
MVEVLRAGEERQDPQDDNEEGIENEGTKYEEQRTETQDPPATTADGAPTEDNARRQTFFRG